MLETAWPEVIEQKRVMDAQVVDETTGSIDAMMKIKKEAAKDATTGTAFAKTPEINAPIMEK